MARPGIERITMANDPVQKPFKITEQAPIHPGFDAETTALGVIGKQRLDGLTAVVTGGYTGIGLETTRVLSEAGATVVVPARTLDKARAAVAGMALVEIDSLDLSDPASVDAFATRFLASGRPLHLLINNAGVMATPLVRDRRGFEAQLATNHLGHFQLTVRLWPALRAAHGARVVALSSRGHRRAGVDFDDPHFQRRPYDKWIAYGQAKTANALFAVALDARGQAQHIRAFSVHPGAVLTEIVRSISDDELKAIRARIEAAAPKDSPAYKNTEQAAATTIWCATSPQLDGMGGVYCEDVDIAEAVPADFPESHGVRPWATDPRLAAQLWQKSEEWTGVGLD